MEDKSSYENRRREQEAGSRRWVRQYQEGRTWEEALRALIRAQREARLP